MRGRRAVSRGEPRRTGFNLVEVLITLTMVALLTTALISFINDYDDKSRLAKARNDLARLAQMAMLAESRSGGPLVMTTDSRTRSVIPTQMADLILELPSHDPWGNRFVQSADGTVWSSSAAGTAYVIDAGFGRIICAGPDGVVNTELGAKPSDTDNDLVVEFRQLPWLAWAAEYGGVGKIMMARADGTRISTVEVDVVNVCFNPDGSRWVGIRNSEVVYGNTSAENPATRTIPPEPAGSGFTDYAVGDDVYPFFFPDGQHLAWVDGDGSLRVFDLYTGSQGGKHRLVVEAGTFVSDNASFTDNLGRILHVSSGRTYYWRKRNDAESSIAISVSPDGKIAYGKYTNPRTITNGIWVALPDGSGRMRIKSGGDPPPVESPPRHLDRDWLPLFWADSTVLVYYAKNADNMCAFGRVGQDGRFDIPLYPANPYASDEQVGPLDPLMPSISPDGEVIHFTHDASGTSKIVRVDGTGWLKGEDKIGSTFTIPSDPIRFQEAIWDPRGEGYYLAQDDATIGIGYAGYRLENPALPPDYGSPPHNTSLDVVPGAMALSPDGTLMAVVSHPSPPSGGGATGVYVFPLQGPDGQRVEIFGQGPDSASTYLRVCWIRN